MRTLDLSETEQYCGEPAPLERFIREYNALAPSERLAVVSRVREHTWAVRRWCESHGVRVLEESTASGVHRIIIERGERAATVS